MRITRFDKNSSVKLNTDGLENLLKGTKEPYVVRVGILGSQAHEKNPRSEIGKLKKGGGHFRDRAKASEMSNADVGLVHEKGVKTQNIPRRSWLQNPLEDLIRTYIEKAAVRVIDQLQHGQAEQAYNELGVNAIQIVQRGFETGGYGKWAPLKPATIAAKHSSLILIDTGQLRKAITFQVVKA